MKPVIYNKHFLSEALRRRRCKTAIWHWASCLVSVSDWVWLHSGCVNWPDNELWIADHKRGNQLKGSCVFTCVPVCFPFFLLLFYCPAEKRSPRLIAARAASVMDHVCYRHNSPFVSRLLTFPGRLLSFFFSCLSCVLNDLLVACLPNQCGEKDSVVRRRKRKQNKKNGKDFLSRGLFELGRWAVHRTPAVRGEACFPFISADKPLWQQFCVVIDVTRLLSIHKHALFLVRTHLAACSKGILGKASFSVKKTEHQFVLLFFFARVYSVSVCGKFKHGKSYKQGVDPFLSRVSLRFCLPRWPIRRLAGPR